MTTLREELDGIDEDMKRDDLEGRLRRWCTNTGFDGGVNSPPMQAADRIADLTAKMEGAIEALKPFSRALDDWGDEPEVTGLRDLYDHPLSLSITIGDFRRAKDALKDITP